MSMRYFVCFIALVLLQNSSNAELVKILSQSGTIAAHLRPSLEGGATHRDMSPPSEGNFDLFGGIAYNVHSAADVDTPVLVTGSLRRAIIAAPHSTQLEVVCGVGIDTDRLGNGFASNA